MDSSLIGSLQVPVRSAQSSSDKWHFVLRLFLVSFFLALLIINSLTGMVLPKTETTCLYDALFLLTAELNTYFTEHVTQRHLMVIFSSALIDFQVLYIAVRFVLQGKSWRMPIALFSFYLFRGLVQSIFIMRFPDGYLWDYPGFFSLAVSYFHTADFFFSGHVGFAFICMCENLWLKKPGLAALSLFTAVTEAFVMAVCRGHYSIDLIAGVIFGHYCWIVSGVVSKALDKKIKGVAPEPQDEYIRLA